MQPHKIVSREEWIEARKAHMAHEKEYTRARDRLSEERRALPWVKVDKAYSFDSGDGNKTLTIGGVAVRRPYSSLVVQHFMFAPEWNEGCKSCSFWADGFERITVHLAARDTTLPAPRAPPRLDAFKQRMGWTFDWFSAAAGDFNYDYAVFVYAGPDSSPAPRSTISAHQASASRRRPASACFIATRPDRSSTPIRASRAGST